MIGILLVTISQALDFITFSNMVSKFGIIVEANPIIAQTYTSYGLFGTLVSKIVLVALIAAIISNLEHHKIGTFVTVVAIVAGALGVIANLNARII